MALPVKNWTVVDKKIIYHCKLCGALCPGRRTSYCSDACAEEWSIRNIPSYARLRVYARDRGVCALCKLDTDKYIRELLEWGWAIEKRLGYATVRMYRYTPTLALDAEWLQHERDLRLYYGARPGGFYTGRRSTGWDMDHIIAVADGGGQCGLDNLRTLCLPCHRAVTRDWRRARAGKKLRNRKEKVVVGLPQAQPIPFVPPQVTLSLKARARASKRRRHG